MEEWIKAVKAAAASLQPSTSGPPLPSSTIKCMSRYFGGTSCLCVVQTEWYYQENTAVLSKM